MEQGVLAKTSFADISCRAPESACAHACHCRAVGAGRTRGRRCPACPAQSWPARPRRPGAPCCRRCPADTKTTAVGAIDLGCTVRQGSGRKVVHRKAAVLAVLPSPCLVCTQALPRRDFLQSCQCRPARRAARHAPQARATRVDCRRTLTPPCRSDFASASSSRTVALTLSPAARCQRTAVGGGWQSLALPPAWWLAPQAAWVQVSAAAGRSAPLREHTTTESPARMNSSASALPMPAGRAR